MDPSQLNLGNVPISSLEIRTAQVLGEFELCYRVRMEGGGFVLENVRLVKKDGSEVVFKKILIKNLSLEGELIPSIEDSNVALYDAELPLTPDAIVVK